MWGHGRDSITGTGMSAYAGGVVGYRGETSLQSAALFYGNWVHSEHVFQAGGKLLTATANTTTLYTDYGNTTGAAGQVPGRVVVVGQAGNFHTAATALGLETVRVCVRVCVREEGLMG